MSSLLLSQLSSNSKSFSKVVHNLETNVDMSKFNVLVALSVVSLVVDAMSFKLGLFWIIVSWNDDDNNMFFSLSSSSTWSSESVH